MEYGQIYFLYSYMWKTTLFIWQNITPTLFSNYQKSKTIRNDETYNLLGVKENR